MQFSKYSKLITDLIYVFIWSAGLLYASFHKVFEGVMNYNVASLTLPEIREQYIFPMVMALLLFLFDAIYSLEVDLEEGRSSHTIYLWICLCAFLIGFLLNIMYESECYSYIPFWISWIALTVMKFFSTNKICGSEMIIPQGAKCNDD